MNEWAVSLFTQHECVLMLMLPQAGIRSLLDLCHSLWINRTLFYCSFVNSWMCCICNAWTSCQGGESLSASFGCGIKFLVIVHDTSWSCNAVSIKYLNATALTISKITLYLENLYGGKLHSSSCVTGIGTFRGELRGLTMNVLFRFWCNQDSKLWHMDTDR